MKRLVLFSLMLGLAALPALAKDDDADLERFLDRYAAAWGSLDPGKAAPLYAKEADLVFYDLLPLKYVGWEAYEKGVRPHFAMFESLKITPQGDLKVTRHGDTAWMTSTVRLDVKPKGAETMPIEARQTLILEKRAGEWKIVHEHLSTPFEVPEHEHPHD
jgi:ketosteroid isomerase-like protein